MSDITVQARRDCIGNRATSTLFANKRPIDDLPGKELVSGTSPNNSLRIKCGPRTFIRDRNGHTVDARDNAARTQNIIEHGHHGSFRKFTPFPIKGHIMNDCTYNHDDKVVDFFLMGDDATKFEDAEPSSKTTGNTP